MDDIKIIAAQDIQKNLYKKHLADVLIVRASGRLYLQQHAETSLRLPGAVHLFGGHVEAGETYAEAAIREIREETGGIIAPADLVYLASLTEAFTNHTELVHVHVWHDKNDTITGCYERDFIEFATPEEAIRHDRMMPYTKWAILECLNRGLLQPSPSYPSPFRG